MKADGNMKKILNVAVKIFTYIVIAVTIFMMVFTIFSVSTFDKNDRSLFGIKFYIVRTDSMSPSELNAGDDVHFDAGDIILIKNIEPAQRTQLQKGEVIAFVSQNSDSRGATITHMIYEVVTNDSGRVIGYKTYGTNTGTVDESLVEPDYVLGVYTGKLPKVGYFFSFLKTTPGYIVCILVPFLLLIIYQGINCISLFRKYKKEQLEEMKKEREQLDAERKQSMEMMRELEALKAQLAQQQTGNNAPTPSSEEASKPAANDKSSQENEEISESDGDGQ